MLTTIVAFRLSGGEQYSTRHRFWLDDDHGNQPCTCHHLYRYPAGILLLGNSKKTSSADKSSAITAVFAHFTQRYGTAVLLIAAGLCVVSLVGINQLQVENRFIDYFRADTEIYQGMQTIDSFGGTTPWILFCRHQHLPVEQIPVSISTTTMTTMISMTNWWMRNMILIKTTIWEMRILPMIRSHQVQTQTRGL